jgi:hypothetical protein
LSEAHPWLWLQGKRQAHEPNMAQHEAKIGRFKPNFFALKIAEFLARCFCPQKGPNRFQMGIIMVHKTKL